MLFASSIISGRVNGECLMSPYIELSGMSSTRDILVFFLTIKSIVSYSYCHTASCQMHWNAHNGKIIRAMNLAEFLPIWFGPKRSNWGCSFSPIMLSGTGTTLWGYQLWFGQQPEKEMFCWVQHCRFSSLDLCWRFWVLGCTLSILDCSVFCNLTTSTREIKV